MRSLETPLSGVVCATFLFGGLLGCSGTSDDDVTPSPTLAPTLSPTPGQSETPSLPTSTPVASPTPTLTPAPVGTPTPEPTPTLTPFPADYSNVVLRRTAQGVVHVTASDALGLGYGVGYAFTEDNFCLLAERIAQVNGRLAEQLGTDVLVRNAVHDTEMTAFDSDRFYRGWFSDNNLSAGYAAGSSDVRALAQGYADGINAYREAHPVLPSCPVAFLGDVTSQDLYRMWAATSTIASGELLAPFIAQQPPGSTERGASSASEIPSVGERWAGSNAWALGAEATQDGSGLHLYNPHFPWEGIQRLYLIHLTIPGELDVMGGTLGGFPVPLAGFNHSMAWGLTFSTAARFTVAELPLTQGDPMAYTVDGKTKRILAQSFSIRVKGEAEPRVGTFYTSELGPLIDAPSYLMGWSKRTAYAIHDANVDNTRFVEQFLELAKASSVAEVEASLKALQGTPWSYVLASDASGEVYFGDVSSMPGVLTEDIEACGDSATARALLPLGIVVLDGGRERCRWETRMSAADQPSLKRQDYVANSNNNYEAPHATVRMPVGSPILGTPGSALALRPSLGLRMIESRLSGADGLGEAGFTLERALEIFLQRRNLGAELLVPELVADCLANPTGTFEGQTVDLTAICSALGAWTLNNRRESQGAHLFRGFWMAFSEVGEASSLFAVPASLEAPLETPRGYTTDPVVRQAARDALARVSRALEKQQVSLTAAWGEVNSVVTNEAIYPLSGGSGREGIFDVIENAVAFYTFDGWLESLQGVAPETVFGASYEHVVRLDASGVEAWGLLAYSQATEPSSPYYQDQLPLLSQDTWFQFPFTEEEIQADPELVRVLLPGQN